MYKQIIYTYKYEKSSKLYLKALNINYLTELTFFKMP